MNKKFKLVDILTFLIPSLFGILFFMIPMKIGGEVTIPIAVLSGWLQDLLADYIPTIMLGIIIITLAGTLIAKLAKPAAIINSPFFNNLFNVTTGWVIVRLLGTLFAVSVYFEVGPEHIWSADTGALLLFDLLPVLFSVFLFAGLLLPLLINFGLLEFFGSLLTKVMRPLFKLPGRSSIDCVASWIGDGTIGVLLTSRQYEEGYYTKKEAAIIGTTFSVVSITFSLVVLSQVGLGHMFVPFYLTILVSGIAAALIMPRIPPLSRKEDTYFDEKAKDAEEDIPSGYTPVTWGLTAAIEKAKKSRGIKEFFTQGAQNILDMWMGVAPVVMALGTLALILAEYTPIFRWIGLPFIPVLELMGVPEATAASETIFVGFADMFLPSVMATGIESEMTRFIVASLSVSQLIYMSEVGGLLLGSKIPVTFIDLVLIFILRTIITLPIIVVAAHILF